MRKRRQMPELKRRYSISSSDAEDATNRKPSILLIIIIINIEMPKLDDNGSSSSSRRLVLRVDRRRPLLIQLLDAASSADRPVAQRPALRRQTLHRDRLAVAAARRALASADERSTLLLLARCRRRSGSASTHPAEQTQPRVADRLLARVEEDEDEEALQRVEDAEEVLDDGLHWVGHDDGEQGERPRQT